MVNALAYNPNPDYPNLHDGHELSDWLDTVLYALAALRSGSLVLDGGRDEGTLAALYTCINDIDTRLAPRLDGLRAALIRAHRAAGGSYGELALAMNAPRPTAQSRARAVTDRPPSHWEQWATGDLNSHHKRRPMRLPGGPLPPLLERFRAEAAAEAAVERVTEPESTASNVDND